MEGYLLETSTLTTLLNPNHPKHMAAKVAISDLDPAAPRYVSVIAIAELMFGQRLIEAVVGASPALEAKIAEAQRHALLDVTRHTAAEYAALKTNLANMYLAKLLRKERPRWVEDWIDKATGQTLQVDENDLWMCAQARERGLVMITADAKLDRVSRADPRVRLEIF